MIPEEGVLLLADLDGVTTELRPVSISFSFFSFSDDQSAEVTYLGDENLVTGSDTHGETLALLVEETGANGEDLGLVLLLDGSLGEEDTGGSLGLGLDALDKDAVQEGGEGLDVAEDRLEDEWLVYPLTGRGLVLWTGARCAGFRVSRARVEGRESWAWRMLVALRVGGNECCGVVMVFGMWNVPL